MIFFYIQYRNDAKYALLFSSHIFEKIAWRRHAPAEFIRRVRMLFTARTEAVTWAMSTANATVKLTIRRWGCKCCTPCKVFLEQLHGPTECSDALWHISIKWRHRKRRCADECFIRKVVFLVTLEWSSVFHLWERIRGALLTFETIEVPTNSVSLHMARKIFTYLLTQVTAAAQNVTPTWIATVFNQKSTWRM